MIGTKKQTNPQRMFRCQARTMTARSKSASPNGRRLRRAFETSALIGAFSLGLAATLTAVGMALVYGRRIVERRGLVPALGWLPVASAAAIVGLGLAFALSGARAIH